MGIDMTTAASTRQHNEVDDALGRLLDLIESARPELEHLRHAGSTDTEETEPSERVASWLYANWYSVPYPTPMRQNDIKVSTNMVREFRTAVASCNLWEHDWVVMQEGAGGSCLAGRSGVTRPFQAGAYANLSRPCAPVHPGDNVTVMKPICWVDPKTTFWCMESLGGPPTYPLVRLYWSVGHDRIALVLKGLVRTLDEAATHYSLKCPTRESDYARVDALVVYLEAKAWPICLSRIRELAQELSRHLRTSIPPLTLRIAPGIAFAESGFATESFGQARCMALAAGVLAILDRVPSSRKEGLAILGESLRKSGINPKKPWLSEAK